MLDKFTVCATNEGSQMTKMTAGRMAPTTMSKKSQKKIDRHVYMDFVQHAPRTALHEGSDLRRFLLSSDERVFALVLFFVELSFCSISGLCCENFV